MQSTRGGFGRGAGERRYEQGSPSRGLYMQRGYPRRGFGRGNRFARDRWRPQEEEPPKGELLNTITLRSLAATMNGQKQGKAVITNCSAVGSFNLVGEDGKIIVPGKPAKWSPAVSLQKLKGDSGTYYRDPNAATWPKYPLEPTIRSMLEIDSALDTSSIDIVCCASTLGNILQFCRENSEIDRPRATNMELEFIGKTLFMVRRDGPPKMTIEGVRGYGHTFVESYTTWPDYALESISHQRVIRYDFAGLKVAVRFEVDAFVGGTGGQGTETPEIQGDDAGDSSDVEDSDDDYLASLLEATKILHRAEKRPSAEDDKRQDEEIKITHAGEIVDQSQLADIKTRAIYNEIGMEEVLRRQWVRQIPHFILAKHDMGSFHPDNISVQDLRKQIELWEKDNQATLSRMAEVLRQIKSVAKEHEGSKLLLHMAAMGRLEIRSLSEDKGSVLPPDLKRRWSRR